MKPNGIFYIDGKTTGVLETKDFSQAQAETGVRHPIRSDARHRRQAASALSGEHHIAQPPERSRALRERG